MTDVVHVQEPEVPRTEELRTEQPDTPKVGRWYYVRTDDGQWLGCVTRLGSNYVRLTRRTRSTNTRKPKRERAPTIDEGES